MIDKEIQSSRTLYMELLDKTYAEEMRLKLSNQLDRVLGLVSDAFMEAHKDGHEYTMRILTHLRENIRRDE